MALDPKQLAAWKALAAAASPPPWDEQVPADLWRYEPSNPDLLFSRAAREAVPALIAEVEWLQGEWNKALRRFTDLDERAYASLRQEWERAEEARGLATRALAVLREVEWSGITELDYEHLHDVASCPRCEGIRPEDAETANRMCRIGSKPTIGHDLDCRLAALLID